MRIYELIKVDRKTCFQLCRFAIIGVITNILGYLLYLLLTSSGASPKITMTILYSVATLIAFFTNKKITFSENYGWVRSSLPYLITNIFGWLLNLIILFVFVDQLGYSHEIVQGIAIIVVAGFLFVCYKLFVFIGPDNCDAKDSKLAKPQRMKSTRK